jgi:GT2 family glycosyltransferase
MFCGVVLCSASLLAATHRNRRIRAKKHLSLQKTFLIKLFVLACDHSCDRMDGLVNSMAKMTPRVFIIILNWNGKEDTAECIESVTHIDYSNFEIFVIDNDSSDDSVEYLEKRYPNITIIKNKRNLGFAEGNNIGIRRAMDAGTDYVLLLNNDTAVDRNFLRELVDRVEQQNDVGFAGPKIYFQDCEGRSDIIYSAGAQFDLYKGISTLIGLGEVDRWQYEDTRDVDSLTGCCLLVSKRLIHNVGLLDPAFFTYWEEADWCIRGHKAGYRSLYVPASIIWHKVGASDPGSVQRKYYMIRNMFWFLRKNATKKQQISSLFYFLLYQFWLESWWCIKHKRPDQFVSLFKGFIDGIFRPIRS